jgi:hypothetical protein
MFERNSDIMLPQKKKNINKINPTTSGKYQTIMDSTIIKKTLNSL